MLEDEIRKLAGGTAFTEFRWFKPEDLERPVLAAEDRKYLAGMQPERVLAAMDVIAAARIERKRLGSLTDSRLRDALDSWDKLGDKHA